MKLLRRWALAAFLLSLMNVAAANTWTWEFEVEDEFGNSTSGSFDWNGHDQIFENFTAVSPGHTFWAITGGLSDLNATATGDAEGFLFENNQSELHALALNWLMPLDSTTTVNDVIVLSVLDSSLLRDPIDGDFIIREGAAVLRDFQPWVVVPIPAALPFFATALAGLGFINRKRKMGQAIPA